MMNVWKAVLYGIVEGITEWLPISSTGHMILLNEFIRMDVPEEFWEVFLVVIQLGAILAVMVLFFGELCPIQRAEELPLHGDRKHRKKHRSMRGQLMIDPAILRLWAMIILACLPAAVIGILFDDLFDALFYNATSVAIALIVFGVGFILIENRNRGKDARVIYLDEIDWKTALMIGGFQVLAAIFPGTSRSGATILGALLIGVSRGVATEFTFFLAIPVMFGASLLKVVKFLKNGAFFTGAELSILLVGLVVAFAVSIFVIRFLLGYIRKHDFKPFGWYRIILGIAVLIIFGIRGRM
ncbi:MAG: undecaprenyl-diphosphate phosphatase [Lachnospiraceae bacterium]|nr:undecaprenyl-diphosphate phosphatase [Lachnospiraceae bacterium]